MRNFSEIYAHVSALRHLIRSAYYKLAERMNISFDGKLVTRKVTIEIWVVSISIFGC